jgi:hypothetical protein
MGRNGGSVATDSGQKISHVGAEILKCEECVCPGCALKTSYKYLSLD